MQRVIFVLKMEDKTQTPFDIIKPFICQKFPLHPSHVCLGIIGRVRNEIFSAISKLIRFIFRIVFVSRIIFFPDKAPLFVIHIHDSKFILGALKYLSPPKWCLRQVWNQFPGTRVPCHINPTSAAFCFRLRCDRNEVFRLSFFCKLLRLRKRVFRR